MKSRARRSIFHLYSRCNEIYRIVFPPICHSQASPQELPATLARLVAAPAAAEAKEWDATSLPVILAGNAQKPAPLSAGDRDQDRFQWSKQSDIDYASPKVYSDRQAGMAPQHYINVTLLTSS